MTNPNEQAVAELAELITDARLNHGITAGSWTLARWLIGHGYRKDPTVTNPPPAPTPTTADQCCPGEPLHGDPNGLHTFDCPVYLANVAAWEAHQAQARERAATAARRRTPPRQPTPPAGPFTPGDPLCYDELHPEGRALRALLHVLTVTGNTLTVPLELAPHPVHLAVAAGWRYRFNFNPDDTGQVAITAELTGWPEPPRPGDAGDHRAHMEQVAAHIRAHGSPAAAVPPPYRTCITCGQLTLVALSSDGAQIMVLNPDPVRGGDLALIWPTEQPTNTYAGPTAVYGAQPGEYGPRRYRLHHCESPANGDSPRSSGPPPHAGENQAGPGS